VQEVSRRAGGRRHSFIDTVRAGGPTVLVQRIADERVPRVAEVDADLVGTSVGMVNFKDSRILIRKPGGRPGRGLSKVVRRRGRR